MDSKLFKVETCHDTILQYDVQSKEFVHATSQNSLRAGYFYRATLTSGFFLSRRPTDQSAEQFGPDIILPVWCQTRENSNVVSFTQPFSGRLFCAQPALSNNTLGKLVANRSQVGPWELFGLVPAETNSQVASWDILNKLKRLISDDLSIAELFEELRHNGQKIDAISVLARVIIDPRHPDLVVGDLLRYADWTCIEAGNDSWLRNALAELRQWEANRDQNSNVKETNSELDQIVYEDQTSSIWRIACTYARSAVIPRKSLCIVATVRNEGIYLIEWIAYHRMLGVEHFFIYSNDNDDGSDAVLLALAESRVITWIKNEVRGPIAPQLKAYTHAFSVLPDVLDYEWALVIDADEFLMLDIGKFKSVQNYIAWQLSDKTDIIALNWMFYGTFGLNRFNQNELCIERIKLRNPNVNQHIKCFCRPKITIGSHAHFPFAMFGTSSVARDSEGDVYDHAGEMALSSRPIAESAWLNHYWSKSIDELLFKFSRNRGDMTNVGMRSALEIIDDVWFRVLKSEISTVPVEDTRILSRLPEVKREIDRLLLMPNVSSAASAAMSGFWSRVHSIRKQLAQLDVTDMPDHVREVMELALDK